MAARQKLRILCFGDSLTAGYSAMGSVYHPYEKMLVQMLEMAFPDMDVETVEDGKPGCTVKFAYLDRIQENFPPKKKDAEPFDWVIVLGGTNDLAIGVPPESVFEKLREVWDFALRRKCKVLALTVPEAGGFRKRTEPPRIKLNDLIKGYKRTGFHVFDLFAAVPFQSMSAQDKERYWDDGLHFTPDGYDLIGNKIGIMLVSVLAREKAENDPVPSRRRRFFRDDEKVFDEEDDDPGSLNKGYIVVRRRDLD
ncbi:SGNH hydrolase-type esterase domain-containing protein [Bombardia bombarda]|uniref:SGNH hydrolase-type esterase domain-containing protein n=1 Tax=Bombardia bombarda TaxID=252184 RepID=A0AA40C7H2_9PEZI|nr:SGNH hydrolase-type esterase domain-containing protein [Bombardia bombarda]